ncbi:MAG: 16S rRNA (cytosine(1402)-N(4))-methyltransferase RsmH [Verrucomicrobia bacterium]|nr:16S rRNA (cytosine(1402)-N(4))-methyltransferase RsmH [Verrucomicrobiota bacterium]
MSDAGERPPRRVRYRGRNPRRFEEKYKEHQPEVYSETAAKVIASGKTPAGSHVPILVAECLAALALRPGLVGVDATVGYGGHAAQILARISPGGRLLGLDADPLELPKTTARLLALGYGEEAFLPLRSNYAGMAKALAQHALGAVDFALADLGCSSMQLDDPARGFSFKTAGPLDMRMNPTRGLSAAEWLARASVDKLAAALAENADEPRAVTLAAALAGRRFSNTLALADAVRAALGESAGEMADLTVRRVFQAVRIAVNDEFGALDAWLRSLPDCLKPGGRVAVLTFHSGEDRRVKQAFRAGHRSGIYAAISEEVITAGAEERRLNPRSSSAKLRWAVRA